MVQRTCIEQFLERYRHFGPAVRAWITTLSMIGAILGGMLFGGGFGYQCGVLLSSSVVLFRAPWASCLPISPSCLRTPYGAFLLSLRSLGTASYGRHRDGGSTPRNSALGIFLNQTRPAGRSYRHAVSYIEAILAGHISYARAMAGTPAIALILAIIGTAVGPERHGAAFSSDRE